MRGSRTPRLAYPGAMFGLRSISTWLNGKNERASRPGPLSVTLIADLSRIADPQMFAYTGLCVCVAYLDAYPGPQALGPTDTPGAPLEGAKRLGWERAGGSKDH